MSQAWKRATLSDLVEIQRGYDLPSQDRLPGNVPVMGGGGMNGYHAVAKVKGPGVVIGRSGAGFGSAFYSEVDYWAHNTVLFVKDFKGNHPKYVFHFLTYFDFAKYNSGGAQPSLNRNFIYPIEIDIPPFPEQEGIAHVFDTWDGAIEKTERLIAVKEKGFSRFIRTMIDDNCSNWKHLRADKIFKSVSEKGNGGAELLSVTQDRGVIPRTMLEGRVMSPEGSTDGYKLIKKGDFAISLRSFQGGIEYSQYQGLISPAYTVLRAKLEIDDDFYRHFFKSYLFIEKFLSIAVIGIRDGKQISIPDFMTVKIPLPPINQQKQIAALLNTVRQEIDLLKKQADAYRRQKRGLMQKLLTGEWRVRTDKETI